MQISERIQFYLGNKFDDIIHFSKEAKPIEYYDNIYNYQMRYFYINSFKRYLYDKGLHKYKFLIQPGDRNITNIKYNSWSFSDTIKDNYSLVKVRLEQEETNVIIRFRDHIEHRHWYLYYTIHTIDIPFINKTNKLVWRGVSTGNPDRPGNRFNLVEKWYNNTQNLNIGFSSICQGREKYNKYVKGNISIEELIKYKYILSVEGNDKDSGSNWKLNSNSVIFMPKPRYISWLMESKLIPNYHYILVKDDFSDLLEKYKWCENNQDKCIEIIKNAKTYMNQFSNLDRERAIEDVVIKTYLDKINNIT